MDNLTKWKVHNMVENLRSYLYELADAQGWSRAEMDALLALPMLTEKDLARFTAGQQRFILDYYAAIGRP